MSDRLLILVADAPSKWRDGLVADLADDEQHEVATYDDGEAFRAALAQGGRSAAGIVVGSGLTGPSAIDVVLAAIKARGEERQKSLGAVFLVTDIRTDTALLDVLRARGFRDFLYRDDAPARTLTKVTNGLYSDRRVEPRYPVDLPVVVHTGSIRIEAKLENMSRGGAQLTLSARKSVKLTPGDKLEIEVRKGLHLPAIVRRASRRKWFLFERILLGVQFETASEETMQEVIRLDQQELEQKVQDTANPF